MKAGSINGHYNMPGAVAHDHLDDLLAAMRLHFELIGASPGLVTADIDSAFRRIPLNVQHRWAAGVAYLHNGIAYVAFHYAMPFGATSSVFNWHRVGDLILTIARRILHMPLSRYVDDYFGPERPENMEQCSQLFARLVRMFLGESAIAIDKLKSDLSLVVLGILVQPSTAGVTFCLCEKKTEKWLACLEEAIVTGRLNSGRAQKLAGKLMWATQHLFYRVGRAMIKPIFAQKTCTSGIVGPRLLRALMWWRSILRQGVSEDRPWSVYEKTPCRLFLDAASTPARLAGVLFCDGRKLYFDGAPSEHVLQQFVKRNDNQITSLEILAIMVALSTFANELRGRCVVIYTDNKGAEGATSRGSAKSFDHNQLIHEIWSHAFQFRMHLWVERVPSKWNIADCPSRFKYNLMEALNAVWRKPVLAELYLGEPA